MFAARHREECSIWAIVQIARWAFVSQTLPLTGHLVRLTAGMEAAPQSLLLHFTPHRFAVAPVGLCRSKLRALSRVVAFLRASRPVRR